MRKKGGNRRKKADREKNRGKKRKKKKGGHMEPPPMEPLPTHPAPRGSSSTQGLGQAITPPPHSKPLARLKTFKLHFKKPLKPPKLCAQGFYFTKKKKKFLLFNSPLCPRQPAPERKTPKEGGKPPKRDSQVLPSSQPAPTQPAVYPAF